MCAAVLVLILMIWDGQVAGSSLPRFVKLT